MSGCPSSELATSYIAYVYMYIYIYIYTCIMYVCLYREREIGIDI